jgi:hypothetical protein
VSIEQGKGFEFAAAHRLPHDLLLASWLEPSHGALVGHQQVNQDRSARTGCPDTDDQEQRRDRGQFQRAEDDLWSGPAENRR